MDNEERILFIRAHREVFMVQRLIDDYVRAHQVPPILRGILDTVREMLTQLKRMIQIHLRILAFQTSED